MTMNREETVPLVTEQIPNNATTFLLPMLLDAEEGEERIRAALLDPTCTAYASWLDAQLAGAAVVRWEEEKPSEILLTLRRWTCYNHTGKKFASVVVLLGKRGLEWENS